MPLDIKTFASTTKVTDGAWGTQLQLKGLAPGACPELWNKENPAAVEAVALSYAQAGSDVILTNTFGGNKFILAQHGAESQVAELVREGAKISVKVAKSTGAKVFGSMGPTGKIVMMEDVPEAELFAAFAQQAKALEEGGVDAIVLETFNELDELKIALRAAKESTKLQVVASMTFASGPDGSATMMGNLPADVAKAAEELGASAVGANCGVGPDNYVKVAKMYRDATDLPIWIKANAGLPVVKDGKTTFPMSPEGFAQCAVKLIDAGANFIGGCCGTSPQFIAALRKVIAK